MNKTELKKMKKDELVNFALTIQNDSIMALELSELKKENNELKCELVELSESYDRALSRLSELDEVMEWVISGIDELDVLYDIKGRLDEVNEGELSIGDYFRLNSERGYIHNLIKIVEGLNNE